MPAKKNILLFFLFWLQGLIGLAFGGNLVNTGEAHCSNCQKNGFGARVEIGNLILYHDKDQYVLSLLDANTSKEIVLSNKIETHSFADGLTEANAKRLFYEHPALKDLVKKVNGSGSVFKHVPTSGAVITINAKHGTFLIGSYPSDLQYILSELNYPKIKNVDFSFSVPSGQKFNLLNISDEAYKYWVANGGFFTKVNGPWIDAAVNQSADIFVVSKMEALYNSPGVLSGFGKEIHRLEWKHGYRFDPVTKMMVPPNKANGLPTMTLKSEYTHN